MIVHDTLRLALRNLRQARLRTVLTTLGVAIGVAALACMLSFGVGIQEQILGQFMKSGVFDSITVFSDAAGFDRIPGGGMRRRGMSREGAPSPSANTKKPRPALDDAALQRINSLKQVKEVYQNLRLALEVKYGSFSEITAAAAVPASAKNEGIFQRISYGSFFPNETDDVCMLSLELARRIPGVAPKDLIGKEVTLAYAATGALADPSQLFGGVSLQRMEKQFRVAGIIEREPGPNIGFALFSSVMLPMRKAQEMGASDVSNPLALLQQLPKKRSYASVTVKVRKPQDVEEVEAAIKEMGFQAFSLNDALKGAKKAFILMDVLLSLIGSISLTVASLGIVNTMVMSILERTREIGIMKAIGGSDGDIRRIFLVEASAIGLAGGILGLVLGWVVGRAINFGANLYIQSQGGTSTNVFSLPWWLILGSIAFSIAISLIAGSYPASRAARLDPIRALRHD
jgi:ABC-type antimicrobial peptide transport system permease subunit